jgi:hypothetical protein
MHHGIERLPIISEKKMSENRVCSMRVLFFGRFATSTGPRRDAGPLAAAMLSFSTLSGQNCSASSLNTPPSLIRYATFSSV